MAIDSWMGVCMGEASRLTREYETKENDMLIKFEEYDNFSFKMMDDRALLNPKLWALPREYRQRMVESILSILEEYHKEKDKKWERDIERINIANIGKFEKKGG